MNNKAKIDWHEEFCDLILCIDGITAGKQMLFPESDGQFWYDRYDGKLITLAEMETRLIQRLGTWDDI